MIRASGRPPARARATRPLVEAHDISKRFGGVQALDRVAITITAGQVHGLVGENGAGNSTLAKVIGGVTVPIPGSCCRREPVRSTRRGTPSTPGSRRSPRRSHCPGPDGIGQRHARDRAPRPASFGRASPRQFDELNARTGFGLDPLAVVRTLRTAEQQKVEILRAIARNARLLLMDEPTAALTRDEADRLLDTVRVLAAGGTSIVLVSHYLEEVLASATP